MNDLLDNKIINGLTREFVNSLLGNLITRTSVELAGHLNDLTLVSLERLVKYKVDST